MVTHPTPPQRRVLLAALTVNGPWRLGDLLTAAGDPPIQRRTVAACRDRGWLVRKDGPPGAAVWDLTEVGRAEVANDIDPSTGRPWGVDESGFNHQEPHAMNEYCPGDSCSYCFGYHCGWFCEDAHNDRSSS
ncbi:hypothetical protein [Dactylosporangium sp. CA-139066]|uniref:hypothetical protein n=1 Tax=Dactylosporangium sp. CA-139066 TaxID=3239930 RepID=UPI003D8F86B7